MRHNSFYVWIQTTVLFTLTAIVEVNAWQLPSLPQMNIDDPLHTSKRSSSTFLSFNTKLAPLSEKQRLAQQKVASQSESLMQESLSAQVTQEIAKSMVIDGCQLPATIPQTLTLIQAIEYTLCQNPNTAYAWANLKSQTARVGMSQSAYLPTLNATGSISYHKRNTTLSAYSDVNSESKGVTVNGGLNFSWVLFDSGLRHSNLEASRQLLDVALLSRDDAINGLFLQTVRLFYQAQSAKATLVSAREAERSASFAFQSAKAQYNAGVGNLADQLQAETAYSQTILQYGQYQGNYQQALGALANIMGFRPDVSFNLAPLEQGEVRYQDVFKHVEVMVKNSMVSHPKVLLAQADLNASQALYQASKVEGKGSVSLYMDTTYNRSPYSAEIANQTTTGNSIGLQMNFRLFDGFNQTYKEKYAQSIVETKKALLKRTADEVALELWKSYFNFKTYQDNLGIAKRLTQTAKKSAEIAEGRYRSGVGTMLELVRAQGEASNASQQYISILTEWKYASIRLAESLGNLEAVHPVSSLKQSIKIN